jgi:nucleoside-diphosphate-sugar epimerase
VKYGIVGHRSWIARSLSQLLAQIDGAEVTEIFKQDVPMNEDLSDFDVIFMIAGRARPTADERMNELALVSHLPTLTRPPKKLVYLSSMAVEREPSPYSQNKLACEAIVKSTDYGRVLRAPVIFGPNQDPYVDMLIPRIARAVAGYEHLVLRQPFQSFYANHVDDVAGAFLRAANLEHGVKVLRMTGEIFTPAEIVQHAAPGTPFVALGGWAGDDTAYLHYQQKEDERKVSWINSMHQIRETIEHLQTAVRLEKRLRIRERDA